MRLLLLALLLCCALPVSAAADAPALKPFHAQYLTLRNGQEVGRTTLELRDNGDGSWTLRSDTRGTSGLARMAGVRVVETSRLRWRDGRPQPLRYDYRQDSVLKTRTRHADFDWAAQRVHVRENGQDHDYTSVPGLIDRQSVTLALALDLLRGASHFEYAVAVADQIEPMSYVRAADAVVTVPAGSFPSAVLVRDRIGRNHRRRVSRSWFAAQLGYLPVQIEQDDGKGDIVTLRLLQLD